MDQRARLVDLRFASLDPLLLPFLSAQSESESDSLLATLLIEGATPIIKGIVRSRFRTLPTGESNVEWQETGDLCNQVLLQIIERLRHCKASPEQQPIADFRGYVAVVSYNVCSHYLRCKYPLRWRLKNRLRYLLSHDASFVLWTDANQNWLCGLAGRQRQNQPAASLEELEPLRNEGRTRDGQRGAAASSAVLASSIKTLFARLGKPVALEDLVYLVAEWQGIKDLSSPVSISQEAGEIDLPDLRSDVVTEVGQRIYLSQLWREICQLSVKQRVALLLNLRDQNGNSSIGLFPVLGIASMRKIAAALEIPDAEFATIWNELPLEDNAIAKRLAMTRQQVINLRKAARDRLSRRMKQ